MDTVEKLRSCVPRCRVLCLHEIGVRIKACADISLLARELRILVVTKGNTKFARYNEQIAMRNEFLLII